MNYYDKPATEPRGGAGLLAQAGMQNAPTEAVRKPSNTEQALKSIEGVHARLDALVSELERRLAAVLMPASPAPGRGGENQAACPLAGKMFNECELASSVADRIDSIISRIDV